MWVIRNSSNTFLRGQRQRCLWKTTYKRGGRGYVGAGSWQRTKPPSRRKTPLVLSFSYKYQNRRPGKGPAWFFLSRFELFIEKCSYCKFFRGYSFSPVLIRCAHLPKVGGNMLARPGCSFVPWPPVRRGCMFVLSQSFPTAQVPPSPAQSQGSSSRATVFLTKWTQVLRTRIAAHCKLDFQLLLKSLKV